MLQLPRPHEYNRALQRPRQAFDDPDLRDATGESNPAGLPLVASGAFALTYRLRGRDGRSWAVRCFHRAPADLAGRYAAIAGWLQAVRRPSLVDVAFQPEGILVGGRRYPVVKMPWVEGEGLQAYVERMVREDPAVLRALAEELRRVVEDLRRRGLAHGDLQHGNILVVGGRPVLVDYDAMFAPPLRGHPASEVGHPNFQHPRRTGADFHPDLDRFSALVLHTALTALAARPELWARHGVGSEGLLFARRDFLDPEASAVFADVRRVPEATGLAAALASACRGPLSDVPSLDQVLWDGRPAEGATAAGSAPPGTRGHHGLAGAGLLRRWLGRGARRGR